jgi:hypothetical protein
VFHTLDSRGLLFFWRLTPVGSVTLLGQVLEHLRTQSVQAFVEGGLDLSQT